MTHDDEHGDAAERCDLPRGRPATAIDTTTTTTIAIDASTALRVTSQPRPTRCAPAIAATGSSTATIPTAVATPLPPRKRRVIGAMWPTTAAARGDPEPGRRPRQADSRGDRAFADVADEHEHAGARSPEAKRVRRAGVAGARARGVEAGSPADERRRRKAAEHVGTDDHERRCHHARHCTYGPSPGIL